MDYNALAKQFWAEGFLLLEGFFQQELMEAMNENIMAHFGVNPEFFHNKEFLETSQTEVVPWFPQNEGEVIFDTVEDEKFNALTDAVLGEGWQNLYCMVMYSKAGTVGQAWHQDCPPADPNHFNINRLVYTTDIVAEIGGEVVVVPGSHRSGEVPPGDPHETLPGQQVLMPKQGDLLLLHGHAFHKVLPIHKACRFSTNFRAIPKDTAMDITDICVYRNMKYSFSLNQIVEQR